MAWMKRRRSPKGAIDPSLDPTFLGLRFRVKPEKRQPLEPHIVVPVMP